MKIAAQAELQCQRRIDLCAQLVEQSQKIGAVIGVAVVGMRSGDDVGDPVRRCHTAHFDGHVPGFGPSSTSGSTWQWMSITRVASHLLEHIVRTPNRTANPSFGTGRWNKQLESAQPRSRPPHPIERLEMRFRRAAQLRDSRLLMHDSEHDLFVLTSGYLGAGLQMSFLGAACAARTATPAKTNQSGVPQILTVVAVMLSLLCLSCGSSYRPTGPNHNAYVTLPARGSVLLLHIDGSTGVMTQAAETPQVQNAAPTGIALLPSRKFLYAVNSGLTAYSISIFAVASDGTLNLTGPAFFVGFGPNRAVVDPSGQYLLVTKTFSTVAGTGISFCLFDRPGIGGSDRGRGVTLLR